MIDKEYMQRLLQIKLPAFPICIPSYNRSDRAKNKTAVRIIEKCDDDIRRNTFMFVRKEQAGDYRSSFPELNIVTLPEVHGLAGTRQYVQDFVTMDLKRPYFIDMDDDIVILEYAFHDSTGEHLSHVWESDWSSILRLGSGIARMAFEKSGCLLGSFHRLRFGSRFPASKTAYCCNRGATPRQLTFVNGKGLMLRGIRRNLAFDVTGDDVGFVAEIAKAEGNFFQMLCLVYDAVRDSRNNSTIRNNDNRRQLAAQEYALLKKYPMRDYLKITHKYEDGSYKYSDIDFRKYREVTGKKDEIVTLEQFAAWLKERQIGRRAQTGHKAAPQRRIQK